VLIYLTKACTESQRIINEVSLYSFRP